MVELLEELLSSINEYSSVLDKFVLPLHYRSFYDKFNTPMNEIELVFMHRAIDYWLLPRSCKFSAEELDYNTKMLHKLAITSKLINHPHATDIERFYEMAKLGKNVSPNAKSKEEFNADRAIFAVVDVMCKLYNRK